MKKDKKVVNRKPLESKFIKFLMIAFYLFLLFILLTALQTGLTLVFTSFSGSACWSLFITLRLLTIMIALGCIFIFFFYLVLYALKE